MNGLMNDAGQRHVNEMNVNFPRETIKQNIQTRNKVNSPWPRNKKKDNVTHPSTKLLFLFLLGCEDRQSPCGWATAISLLGSNINTITYPSLTADRSSNSDEYLFSLRLEWTTTTGSHCPMVKQTTIMSTFSYLITQSSLSNHDTPPIMGTFTLSFKVVT